MYFETASASRSLPSSSIIMTATPTTGFVIEARRKTASRLIGFLVSTSIVPCASTKATWPLRATSITAPVMSPESMWRCTKV